jgi:hypothetical protein
VVPLDPDHVAGTVLFQRRLDVFDPVARHVVLELEHDAVEALVPTDRNTLEERDPLGGRLALDRIRPGVCERIDAAVRRGGRGGRRGRRGRRLRALRLSTTADQSEQSRHDEADVDEAADGPSVVPAC